MAAIECDHHKTVGKGHWRIETRECWATSDPDYLSYINEQMSEWPGLSSLAMVKSKQGSGRLSAIALCSIVSVVDMAGTRRLTSSTWSLAVEPCVPTRLIF